LNHPIISATIPPDMGIEGGFGGILRCRDHFRNPEFSQQELDILFRNQGGHGEPILIDPPPQTFNELLEADEGTARLLQLACVFTNRGRSLSLIGGLAVAAYTGRVYRCHDDLDFCGPRDWFESPQTRDPGMQQLTNSIYRVMVKNPQPEQKPPQFQVDLFVYDGNGFPYDFGGDDKGHIPIGLLYPLQTVTRSLYGLPLRVAPLFLVAGLKSMDSRPKGRLDYQMLAAEIL